MPDRTNSTSAGWIRALDMLAIGAIAIGVSALVSGGFREWTPFGRLSIRSWGRPVGIGVALIVLRHVLSPRPSIVSSVAGGVQRLRNSADSRVVWPIFLASRVGVLAAGFLGLSLIGYAPNTPPWRVHDNDLLNMPARWDTGWYLGIAEKGYAWDASRATSMQNIAFFPGYPMLIRYGSLFVGRQRLWAGVLISFVAFFVALHYLLRLARDHLGDDDARTAVALLAAYPFALFYSTAYTEALFLLTSVAACFHLERDEPLKAGLWGFAAGLSRPNGCLLSVVLALLAIRGRAARSTRALSARVVAASMPGIGMLVFSGYIYTLTGRPLEWASNHAAFGRVYRGFFALLDDRIRYVEANGLYNYATVLSLDMINAIPVVFALGCVWPVYRRFGAPYAVMILVNVLTPVLMGGVLSMGRVTSVLFPIFLWLGASIPAHHRAAWLMAFAMLQAVCAVAFFTWRPLV